MLTYIQIYLAGLQAQLKEGKEQIRRVTTTWQSGWAAMEN